MKKPAFFLKPSVSVPPGPREGRWGGRGGARGRWSSLLKLSLRRGAAAHPSMASRVRANVPEQMVLRQESEGQEKVEGCLKAKLTPGEAVSRWSCAGHRETLSTLPEDASPQSTAYPSPPSLSRSPGS